MSNVLNISTMVILLPVFASAGELDDPYASSNRSPFIQVYGLPAAESGKLTKQAAMQWGLQLEAASNATYSRSGDEFIIIDGESHRVNLQFRYGVTHDIELGLDIPYLRHEGGRLDGFINDWHDFFSLPEGDRPNLPQDQLAYNYQQGDNTIVNVMQASDGLGDVRINLAYQLSNTDTRQWALRGGIKLPTGDAQFLQGSESTDIFLGANVSDQALLQAYNMRLHASAGVLWTGDSEVIDQAREDWVVYGSSTLSWRYSPRLSFKTQVDFHSAVYDSALAELGEGSAQLVLGGAVQVTDNWVLDLSVSEDIAVNTASDVVFQLGLTLLDY
ncbi:MAG: DUF3187 family protein [Spongiibacteraceae bacterium]|nr:DUF3187 family protein [Spongiibacteraceae bacterium]